MNQILNRGLLGFVAAAIMIAFLSGSVYAHTLWIQSSRYQVKKSLAKPMFFGWGHYLPLDDAISGDKLRYINIFDPTGSSREIEIREDKSLQSHLVTYDQVGTYCLAAETNPGYYTVYKDKNGKTHHATKPKCELPGAKDISLSVLTLQSTKAYVVCEEPSDNVPGLVGFQLELTPLHDPNRLKPGDELPLEVFFKGKRFEGKGKWVATYNGYSTAGEDYYYKETEVEGGRFKVPIICQGVWFVRFSFKKEAAGEEAVKCNHLNYKTTLVFQVSEPAKEAHHEQTKSFKVKGIDFRMVYMPSGTFVMGSPPDEKGHKPEEIQHRVTFTRGFWIGRTEVTQELYQTVMTKNPSYYKGPDLPVENVSWNDAVAFIQRLNDLVPNGKFNLPTEAQWEYACRAGSKGAYCFGSNRANLGRYAWLGDNTHSRIRLKPVATKKPNAWAIYDMHGNLWEWCRDWYGEYPRGSVKDPTGVSSGTEKVCRGGSWLSGAGGVRCSDRDHVPPDYANTSVGFRVTWTP
ncbi:MAG: SUMF1/EgtB/PvdO family nonheme iron enzyme [Thermodesulfobacteriota bacterium]|nr:SUMF1/EgtB/PvdO family nonheme iron enzyme [Thermodesulfobacteriota bacterium]